MFYVYVLLCVILCPLYLCNHLDEEERAGCFALFVFLVSHDCWMALSHDTTGLSAVCDCGISRSYSLTIFGGGQYKENVENFKADILPKKTGPEVIKRFSCSTQLSTTFILLINVKMPTTAGILTFISIIGTPSERLKVRNFFIGRYFSLY